LEQGKPLFYENFPLLKQVKLLDNLRKLLLYLGSLLFPRDPLPLR
jgi:hypothetical protein